MQNSVNSSSHGGQETAIYRKEHETSPSFKGTPQQLASSNQAPPPNACTSSDYSTNYDSMQYMHIYHEILFSNKENEVLLFTVKRVELKYILSKIKQTDREDYCMFSIICGVEIQSIRKNSDYQVLKDRGRRKDDWINSVCTINAYMKMSH